MRLISHYFIGFYGDVNRFRRFLFLLILLVSPVIAAEPALRFSAQQILQWPEKQFEGNTRYQLAGDQGQKVVRAISRAGASGLFYETEIDLNKTPYLSWRWQVRQLPDVADEQVKAGDDFAARVYIVVNDGWTFLSTKAISYVWSAQSPAGEAWPNPFAGDSAMMVSVRHQAAGDIWYTEKRNLKADLKRLFGKEITTVKAVAVMTDTDNSGSTAEAFYGDLVFSAE